MRVAAVEVGDEAAGLAHQDHAGRDVPGREAALPVAVEPAGRDAGEIERGRAEPAQARDLVLDGAELAQAQLQIAAAEMRQAAGDHASARRLRAATRSRWSLRNAPLPRSAVKSSSVTGL